MTNDMGTVRLRHVLTCQFSGLPIGELEVIATAGTLPYLTQWKDCVAMHPVFSMSHAKLLKYTEYEWDRLAQRAEDMEITADEANVLRVCCLALLHSMDCIKQDVPGMPTLATSMNCLQPLLVLSQWKAFLQSKRFSFPIYHVSRYNQNAEFGNLGDYLEACFEVRRNYERGVNDAVEKEQVAAANRAALAINNAWIRPPSRRVLWQWIRANLPSKFQPDAEGWLGTLFLGGTATICEFEREDIDLAIQIITSECPNGTGPMHFVRKRLDDIEEVWERKYEAFEIDLSDFAPNAKLLINGQRQKAADPGPEPKATEFPTRAKFLVAQAKWTIARAAWLKENPQ